MKKLIKMAGIVLAATALLGLTGCPGTVDKHEHSFATEWSHDGTYHWHTATCEHREKVADKASHTFGDWDEGKRVCTVCDYEQICEHSWNEGLVVKEPTLSEKGEITYTCTVCNQTKTEAMDKLPVSSFNWYESPVDFKTKGPATSSSEYVLFGAFPRTIKEDDVEFPDDPETVTMGANTYYKAKDGKYYAKVIANPYPYSSSKEYSDGTIITAGEEVCFQVEPIKWRVLTKNFNGTGKALLLAEEVLTANVPFYMYNNYSSTRSAGTDTKIFHNNYKYSQIRAYLNGIDYYSDEPLTSTTVKLADYTDKGFLQTAFTSAAQDKIAVSTVDNTADSTTDETGYISKAKDYVCENTLDKIFLLSLREATTTAYGFDGYKDNRGKENPRAKNSTDYAMANYSRGSSGYWWIRTPYNYTETLAHYVAWDGYCDAIESVKFEEYGVVPALTMSLE